MDSHLWRRLIQATIAGADPGKKRDTCQGPDEKKSRATKGKANDLKEM
jgi:hypothetical protein